MNGWTRLAWLCACAALLACTDGPGVVDAGDGGAPPDETGAWIVKAPLPFGARQETAVVALRGEIVVIAGLDESALVVSDVSAYDPATDAWRALAPLPVAMHHANAAVVDDKIYVLGFLRTLSFAADGRGFVYDPDLDAWAPTAALPAGTERGGGVAVADGDDVLVVGGVRGGAAVTEVSRYDPETDTHTVVASLPAPRDHLVGANLAGTVVVAGGREARISSHSSTTYAFVDGAWTERAPMPTSRGGMAAAAVGTRLFVLGGEGDASTDTGVFDDVESYDVDSDAWTTWSPMARPRHGMGAAAIAGVIYVPGGADIEGLAAVAVHEALVVDEAP